MQKAFGLLALVGIMYLAYSSYKKSLTQNKPKLNKDLE